jgi:thiosulfate reductase cytochrome b subunit
MAQGRLVRRHGVATRVAHWVWAVAMFFLLLSGLQIFNAHPALYLGDQTGFEFDNAVLRIGGVDGRGVTEVFGVAFDTTGVLGGEQAFPAAVTIPSTRDLATGRVVHVFFAWVLVGALLVWAVSGRVRALWPTGADLRGLPQDVADHARLRFHHREGYGVLQKLAYAGVMFVALPLMVATGLAMSPGMNAAWPWLPELLGGRQTARTIHFVTMVALVGFFAVHMAMILLAGPLREMRAMVTGWVRLDEGE